MRRVFFLACHLRKMSTAAEAKPLIAVVGATGTGKSELAVELAQRFNGEVINGDAMQMYEDLPIITNKLPIESRKGVPHHLLGCIGLSEPTWTVTEFVKEALSTISEIRARGRIPILVGGTHYYTQSLIFKDALAEQQDSDQEEDVTPREPSTSKWPILSQPTPVILEELRQVDPIMADRWHPNDRRKIQRSLEIWLQTGKPASQVYEEQRLRKTMTPSASDEEASSAPQTRFPTIIFWVHAEKETLRARLDTRVNKMVQHGLLDEVRQLHDYCQAKEDAGASIDKTRGIWVSIGYKEFEAYQAALKASASSEGDLKKLQNEAIERTQIATRQYTVRQLRWIRIKLINALAEANALNRLFLLDGSHADWFDEEVVAPAVGLTYRFLQDDDLPDPRGMSEVANEMLAPKRDYDLGQRPDVWVRKTCEPCEMTAVTEAQWETHIKGKKHKAKLRAKNKAEREDHSEQSTTAGAQELQAND